MDVEVKIRALMMDPNSGTPIVVLKDVNSEAILPIWVGAFEANAIALEIEKITAQRPLTHDLLRNLIIGLGLTVERVVVTELKESTFFAVIEMRDAGGAPVVLDARPSDAIALALRADCPVFVSEEVFAASARQTPAAMGDDEDEESNAGASEDEWPEVIGGDLPM